MSELVSPGDHLTEPSYEVGDTTAVLLGQLDYHRAVTLRKLDDLGQDGLRATPLPSGWSARELLRHLTFMERRWIRWGFLAEPVLDPHGDVEPGTDCWVVPHDVTDEQLRADFLAGWADTRRLVADVPLTTRAALGGRFSTDPPTLGWILLHVLQEYARHNDHLDAVGELITGRTGE